nr:hypothetical protein [Clostridium psychrophilum]
MEPAEKFPMAKNNEVIMIAQIGFVILQSLVWKNPLNATSSANAKINNLGICKNDLSTDNIVFCLKYTSKILAV